jgi:hypothetical protein
VPPDGAWRERASDGGQAVLLGSGAWQLTRSAYTSAQD